MSFFIRRYEMPRPVRVRRICEEPKYTKFVPEGADGSGAEVLTIEEYEVIRHVDYRKMTHEECARKMAISRTTVTEIYETARYKIADAIVNGRVLTIEGGNYRVCEGGECCIAKTKPCDGEESCNDKE